MSDDAFPCLVNGLADTLVSVRDRGLAYGDGLFETLPIRWGSPEFWRYHWERLTSGCRRLGIELPAATESQVLEELHQLVEQSGLNNAVAKLIITRGAGGRGYRSAPGLVPNRILYLSPLPSYPERWESEGVVVRQCCTPLGLNPVLAGLKHLNRLEQVLARAEWQDDTIAEGLLCDCTGNVIEGTMSNLFLVKAQRLLTPRLDQCGVAGVMRRVVMELYQGWGAVEECHLSPADILEADELFLTNSVVGIWPVRAYEQHVFPVGPQTRRLIEALRGLRASAPTL